VKRLAHEYEGTTAIRQIREAKRELIRVAVEVNAASFRRRRGTNPPSSLSTSRKQKAPYFFLRLLAFPNLAKKTVHRR
jgi:hypothetical protein